MAILKPVQIVLCIDKSGSMNYYGYITSAKTDASTFVDLMISRNSYSEADAVGVVSFNSSAYYTFDGGNEPPSVAILTNEKVKQAAKDAIATIKTSGSTNIQTGLDHSNSLINADDSSRNPAIILISDGHANDGIRPPKPPRADLPIYTIALGPNSDTSTLKNLADETNGQYHLSPDVKELESIYIDIALETGTVSSVISNDLLTFSQSQNAQSTNIQRSISAVQSQRVGGLVPETAEAVTLVMSWTEENISYTSGTPTNNNQFTLDVYINGSLVPLDSIEVSDQYLNIPITKATAGVCIVDIQYLGESVFEPTVGILDYTRIATSDTNVIVDVNRHVNVGETVNLSAYVEDANNQILPNVTFKGTISAPQKTGNSVTDSEIRKLLTSDAVANDEISENELNDIQNRLLEQGPTPKDLYQFTAIQHEDSSKNNGSYTFIPNIPGIYVIRLQAECKDGPVETHFSKAKVVTVQVK